MKAFETEYANSFSGKAAKLAEISYEGRQYAEGTSFKSQAPAFKAAGFTPR